MSAFILSCLCQIFLQTQFYAICISSYVYKGGKKSQEKVSLACCFDTINECKCNWQLRQCCEQLCTGPFKLDGTTFTLNKKKRMVSKVVTFPCNNYHLFIISHRIPRQTKKNDRHVSHNHVPNVIITMYGKLILFFDTKKIAVSNFTCV